MSPLPILHVHTTDQHAFRVADLLRLAVDIQERHPSLRVALVNARDGTTVHRYSLIPLIIQGIVREYPGITLADIARALAGEGAPELSRTHLTNVLNDLVNADILRRHRIGKAYAYEVATTRPAIVQPTPKERA